MLDWTATREVRVMPKKRYTPEEIIQHLRTVELDSGKGLAVLDSCRKLGITEQDARSASQRGTVLHAERSPDHHRTLEDSLQHGPSAQQSRGPATRSRNYPACELRTNMGGGTTTPGWSRPQGFRGVAHLQIPRTTLTTECQIYMEEVLGQPSHSAG